MWCKQEKPSSGVIVRALGRMREKRALTFRTQDEKEARKIARQKNLKRSARRRRVREREAWQDAGQESLDWLIETRQKHKARALETP
mgnify:CR=1 FL=1